MKLYVNDLVRSLFRFPFNGVHAYTCGELKKVGLKFCIFLPQIIICHEFVFSSLIAYQPLPPLFQKV